MGDAVRGSCFCGAVRFSIEQPVSWCGHCHCTMCQRSHGAGYVTWLVVPRRQFSIDAGEAELTRFASSDHGTRSFCRRCGSSLLCESTHHPDDIDVVLANVESVVERAPEAHIYFDDRASWMRVDDELPRLGGVTGVEPIKDDE